MSSTISSEQSPVASSPSTPSRRLNKKERLKMISQITILDATTDGKILVSLKIEDCPFVDDNSLSLLSLPDGPFMSSEPIKPCFHSFVITVQNGQRIYGGSFIFGLKQIARSQDTDEHKVIYMSRALVALTIRPLVDQLKKLLEWCVNQGGCNPRWLRCLVNIPLPQKGKCINIHLPDIKNINKGKYLDDLIRVDSPSRSDNFMYASKNNDCKIVAIFRPFSIFPLFDYSFHALLNVLSIDNLLLLFTCALNEVQILLLSSSYYNLMLISECITALLNPFKWQHVYVPILPTKLGLHYLDAPTPFIMGINSRLKNYLKTSKIACFVDCDNRKIELNVDHSTFYIPPFIEDLRIELQEIVNSDPRLCSNVQKSEALKRVSELAHKYNVISDQFTYLDEMKLSQSIRILFLKKIKKHILNKYQHFIAYVSDKKEQIKFDSVSYLSDQPLSTRQFLQHFVETQMFATFIDDAGKTILKKQQKYFSDANLVESLFYEEENDDSDFTVYSDKMIESRFNTAQQVNLIELEDMPNQNNLLSVTMSPCRKRLQSNISIKNQPKSATSSPSRNVPTALSAQTNWKVVETLLKEVKIKTKKILLVKMGSDEVGNSASPSSISNLEENTLIAALCDLIERIWSHARSDDYEGSTQWESSKCPFWSHLTAFHEFQQNLPENCRKFNDSSSQSSEMSDSMSGVTWTSLKKRIDSFSQLSLEQNGLSGKDSILTKAIPSTLVYDYKSICEMKDIKSDVGKSRAFIRLSLERKLLSKHLRTLLYNQELLQSLYKRYSFLRCEEEREQFLTHLLTLNAVDLPCFTNTFTTSSLCYTLLIGATSQFNGFVYINGSYGCTTECISISSNQLNFKHKNFGIIHSLLLTINCNQKNYVEQCFIRNNVTNCLYKFECNKWLGKNIDDGSVERLLIGEIVHGSMNDHLKKSSSHLRSSSIGRNWSRGTENTSKEEKYSAEDLQSMLGESINLIMKFYFSDKCRQPNQYSGSDSPKTQKTLNLYNNKFSNSSTLGKVSKSKHLSNCRSMISLFFGERKFLWIMNHIFYFGFKNRRSFRKQNFIWDYILRVQCEYKHTLPSNMSSSDRHQARDFVSLIDKITDRASNYGKDMKFQLFILISLREHKLSPYFLKLLSRPNLAQLHYDSDAFLRDGMLFSFISQILKTFNEIELKFDTSLTKDI